MHDLTLAGLYSDRLVLMHEGAVVANGQPADVLRPETLAEFYGVRVTVHHEPDGTVVVIPRRWHHMSWQRVRNYSSETTGVSTVSSRNRQLACTAA